MGVAEIAALVLQLIQAEQLLAPQISAGINLIHKMGAENRKATPEEVAALRSGLTQALDANARAVAAARAAGDRS